jgi:AcrR family transcriptional regulator
MAQTVYEDTKDRILEAAGQIFAEKGFRNATVRDICQSAQANLAAVNYHFGDKERLYIETVKRAHRARMDHASLPEWPPETSPAAKLHGFIYMFLRRMLADDTASWHTHLMLRELADPTAACAELVREFIRPHFEVLMSILAELVPPETSEIERHQIGFSIVGQCLHYRVAQPIVKLLITPEEYAQYDAERLAEHISRWTLAALGAAPALAKQEARA